jgi:hypothetical protein
VERDLITVNALSKEKSTADGCEGSESMEGDEHGNYEGVEKTHESVGVSTAYQARTNGYCWAGLVNLTLLIT